MYVQISVHVITKVNVMNQGHWRVTNYSSVSAKWDGLEKYVMKKVNVLVYNYNSMKINNYEIQI